MFKPSCCQNFLPQCSSFLSFIHNYFDGPTKLFLDLYLAKFLNQQNRFFYVAIKNNIILSFLQLLRCSLTSLALI